MLVTSTFSISQNVFYLFKNKIQCLKSLLEEEKLLITSNFSFSHSVFTSLVMLMCKNQSLFGKGLKYHGITCFILTESNTQKVKQDTQDLIYTSRHSSMVRALDLKTRGCGFDSWTGQPNNF